MTILKSTDTAALDDVMQAADEVIERIDTLVALQLGDSNLESALKRHSSRLSAAIDRLREQRQAGGDLPAAGNVERAELAAVAQKVRSFFSTQAETSEIAEHMASTWLELADSIDAARDTIGDDHPLCRSLRGLGELVADFRRELQNFI